MSEITKLQLQVKKSRKLGSNKITLSRDVAERLVDEITALHAQIKELENAEPKYKITPKEELARDIQVDGGSFKDN